MISKAIATCGAWMLCLPCAPRPDSVPPPTDAGSTLARIRPAPEVTLTDQHGERFRLETLRGKAVMVSFIYTTCGGTCPATTHSLYRVQQGLRDTGLWGGSVEFVSISLDPARDTPEVLTRYARTYGADPRAWHFLTGDAERVAEVLDSWDMWARPDDSGVIDHPSRIFLIDPEGTIREIYNLDGLDPDVVRADLRSLLSEGRGHRGQPDG